MKLTTTELHFITICAIAYGCGMGVVKIITYSACRKAGAVNKFTNSK